MRTMLEGVITNALRRGVVRMTQRSSDPGNVSRAARFFVFSAGRRPMKNYKTQDCTSQEFQNNRGAIEIRSRALPSLVRESWNCNVNQFRGCLPSCVVGQFF